MKNTRSIIYAQGSNRFAAEASDGLTRALGERPMRRLPADFRRCGPAPGVGVVIICGPHADNTQIVSSHIRNGARVFVLSMFGELEAATMDRNQAGEKFGKWTPADLADATPWLLALEEKAVAKSSGKGKHHDARAD